MTPSTKGAPDTPDRSRLRFAFVHDHRFIRAKDFIGSHAQFESELWDRYLRFCGRLTVVGREGFVDDHTSIYNSSHPDVDFVLMEDQGRGIARALGSREARAKMQKVVADHDVIVARIPSVFGLQAIAEARRQDKVCAIEVVGCPWDALFNYGSLAGRIYAPVQFLQMRHAVRNADHAIYVTEQFLQRRYPTDAANTAFASNVELEQGAPDAPGLDPAVLERRLHRIERFDPDASINVGLIGTLQGRTKGIQYALAAIRSLRERYPAISLHVLGGGSVEPWQQEAASLGVSDEVKFVGTLPSGQPVRDWLGTMDIYIQPSLQEGLPRALVEAMSRGLPAIGSDRAGIPELLEAHNIVPAKDPAALAAAIERFLTDPQKMAASARINFAKASEFTVDLLTRRRTAFFEKVLADPRISRS